MISFSRTQVVGAEFFDNDIIRFNGIQEDHIYSMEIQMDVRAADGEIAAIQGIMKRYTNFVCPQAVPVLQQAVGKSLRQEGWDRTIMREIGRQGCEHFAEIIIECGRCLDQAMLARDLWQARGADPGIDEEAFIARWLENRPAVEAS